ncbi:tetratricopeptide repeat protein [candidate division CSSED10-310 bacterium]|uniref:Tetratricopeptide repeat protein n=1 Tax=candidate division CSSED10-310 bacterium TaxID=2855610 RepID=A0ABV6Z386_UNCC1
MKTTPDRIGPYQLLELLGQGGMGVVYHAQHVESKTLVALKTIRIADEMQLESIRREIRGLTRMAHPGIVTILDEGVVEGIPWYAMELISGENMRHYFKKSATHAEISAQNSGSGKDTDAITPNIWWSENLATSEGDHTTAVVNHQNEAGGVLSSVRMAGPVGRRCSVEAVALIMYRLCAPLAFLHGEGMVHRDLKPENIIITPEGRPVLVDFGLAAQFSSEQSREVLNIEYGGAGTVYYIAPEQIQGILVDARADLYALGCIMFELLVGHPPFQGGHHIQVLNAHLNTKPSPLSKYRPDVPPEIDELVMQLLAKKPRDRLGHIDSVTEVLKHIVGEDDIAQSGPEARSYLYRPAFTGHAAVLDRLDSFINTLSKGRGGLILVGGESGVGKTRLMMEFGRSCTRQKIDVLAGECSDRVDQAFESFLKPLQTVGDRCRERGQAESDRILGQRAKILAPYVTSLADIPGQEHYPDPPELPPDAALVRLYKSLSQTWLELSRESPLLLILDDLHWADDLVLGYLEYELRCDQLKHNPVLIVGTYRPEQPGNIPTIINQAGLEVIILDRLDEEGVAAIVGDMLGLSSPPVYFSRYLTQQSEGIPLFVAEYLHGAIDAGLIYRDEKGLWQVGDEADAAQSPMEVYQNLPFPHSLQEIIGQRLLGLNSQLQEVVNFAAVIGREVQIKLLRAALKLPDEKLIDLLAVLEQRQIFDLSQSGLIRFVHSKLREVALNNTSQERRITLHRQVAESMESLFSNSLADYSGQLGHHWEQAGDHNKASTYYLSAARRAKARYDYGEARQHYLSYLNLVDESNVERAKIRIELVEDVYRVQGRFEPAAEQLELALYEFRSLKNRLGEARCLSVYGVNKRETGKLDEAREMLNQALNIAQNIDQKTASRCLANLAILSFWEGELDQARNLCEQALNVARKMGDRQFEGQWLGNLATMINTQGDIELSITYTDQAVEIARQRGDRLNEERFLANLANLYHQIGKLEQAEQLCTQALSLSRDLGDRMHEGFALGVLSSIRSDQGRFDQAQLLLEEAIPIFRETNNKIDEAWWLGMLAYVYLMQGKFNQAQPLYDEALTMARKMGTSRTEVHLLTEKAKYERFSGAEASHTWKILNQAAEIVKNAPEQYVHCLCEKGHLALASGQTARPYLEEILNLDARQMNNQSSLMARDVRKLQRAQKLFDSGQHHELMRGTHSDDIPPPLQAVLTPD